MRVILYTGKGGVGKTSVAAASALRLAELGYKTIIISTDVAHSLADSFEVPLGATPTSIGPNLWGQEVDILHEIKANWGAIQKYMIALLAWQGLDLVVAEEMAILPGMDEVSSLLYITRYQESGDYDVVVVDCAPTGETLRLLAFPDIARWWIQKILPIERRATQVIRPLVGPLLHMPFPEDEVFEAVEKLFGRLDKMRSILSDPEHASIRLVLNPEKMVIKEAQRTFTYLNLYGYPTDAIVCNRLIPAEVESKYFEFWKESQDRYFQLIEEAFSPIPILRVPFFDREVVGQDMLRRMAEALFGSRDPGLVFFKGRAQHIEKGDGYFSLTIPLPFATKGDVSLLRSGDELVVQVGSQRRNIILPRALAAMEVSEARMEEATLRIRFDKKDAGSASKSKLKGNKR
ncbi:MAG: TRC40/GET3/ArsA family transport-energizing ATPase [Dehalococcoidia bacterium]|nr:TRC40/GET3/ArsA family transport-energizing ATPase [Dehalococcoidia bacterium]